MKYKPYKHQKNILSRTKEKKAFALFWEQGAGKTKPTIDLASYLYKKGEITLFLIIAPNGVHRNWIEQELIKHEDKSINYYPIVWENKNTIKYNRALDFLKICKTKLKVLSVNIDSINVKKCYTYIQNLLKYNKALIALDESSRIKNPKAKRTKKILYLSKQFKKSTYRRILSGTPLTKDLLDLYTQFEFLDKKIFSFSSFYSYKHRYAEITLETRKTETRTWQYENITGFKNIDELKKKIKPWHSRILLKNCLDLPSKIYQNISVEMLEKQKIAYDQIEEELFLSLPKLFFKDKSLTSIKDERKKLAEKILKNPDIVVQFKLTQVIRLREITSGFIKNTEGSYILFDKNSKLKALQEDIEIIYPNKILIWAYFRFEIEMLYKYFSKIYGKDQVSFIHGEIKEKQRAYIRKLFQDIDPKAKGHKEKKSSLKILILNPATGGIGFDLNKAHYVYYYSNDYNAENRWQSEGRVHRAGLDHPVVYKDIYCKDSIEEEITENLLAKKKQSQEILDNN